MFLSNTLNNIIKRFEDEFPDTRITDPTDSAIDLPDNTSTKSTSSSNNADPKIITSTLHIPSTTPDDDADPASPTAIKSPALSRSNSLLSLSSKALADEEGRVLRAGHKFRAGVVADQTQSPRTSTTNTTTTNGSDPETPGQDPDLRAEHYALLTSGVEMVGADPKHVRILHDMLEECGEELRKEAEVKGAVEVFTTRREEVLRRLRELDPVYWERFVESQEMARANSGAGAASASASASGAGSGVNGEVERGGSSSETAVED